MGQFVVCWFDLLDLCAASASSSRSWLLLPGRVNETAAFLSLLDSVEELLLIVNLDYVVLLVLKIEELFRV